MLSVFLQMTPDEDFILDFHPQHRNVVIGAGFSGRLVLPWRQHYTVVACHGTCIYMHVAVTVVAEDHT